MQDQGEQITGTTFVADKPVKSDPILSRCQMEIYKDGEMGETAETIFGIHSRVFPQSLDPYRINDNDPAEEIDRKHRVFEVDRKAKIRHIKSLVSDPGSSLIFCKDPETGKDIGYTLAVPVKLIDAKRTSESGETAYIFNTEFLPDYQGHGLVGKIMPILESQLKGKGYSFIERDVRMGNGYHLKIEKNYGNRIVTRSGPHDSWIGPQMFYRIRL